VSAGNEVVGSGSAPNLGGWDCQVLRSLDFDLLAALGEADGHDVGIDPEHDRVDCIHCWAGFTVLP
jgi:hypothetical protein